MAGDTKHIYQSLVANGLIAIGKGTAAFFTGSGALLAETLHSASDCGNQLLLLLGVKRAQKPADARHPLGYGRSLYFWSFMVALLLFAGGGVFSIYEGIHKLGEESHDVENVWWGIGILVFSLLIEGWATGSNIRELNRRRGSKPFFRYLRETKDSDLVVVFGENGAATLGLAIALASLLIAWATHDTMWDAVGTICIGLVLIAVAIFLAVEVKGLLVGESADTEIGVTAQKLVAETEHVREVRKLITVQQGPGEVVLAMKLAVDPEISAEKVSALVNGFEAKLRAAHPAVKWSFIEIECGAPTEPVQEIPRSPGAAE